MENANSIMNAFADEVLECIQIPQIRLVTVSGRKEHESILKDEKKMENFGLNPNFERMMYLKRWGKYLTEE